MGPNLLIIPRLVSELKSVRPKSLVLEYYVKDTIVFCWVKPKLYGIRSKYDHVKRGIYLVYDTFSTIYYPSKL